VGRTLFLPFNRRRQWANRGCGSLFLPLALAVGMVCTDRRRRSHSAAPERLSGIDILRSQPSLVPAAIRSHERGNRWPKFRCRVTIIDSLLEGLLKEPFEADDCSYIAGSRENASHMFFSSLIIVMGRIKLIGLRPRRERTTSSPDIVDRVKPAPVADHCIKGDADEVISRGPSLFLSTFAYC
jgi:hypothetical protein